MTPDEWRERVGVPIQRRREQLRLSMRRAALRAGFSEGQWRQMESGRRTVARNQFVTVHPRPATRSAACAALLWTEDSIDRLEAGEQPIVLAEGETHTPGLHRIDESRVVAQLRLEFEQLRRDHLALADIVHELAAGPAAASTQRAAAGSRGRPPRGGGRVVRGPQPVPEDGDHLGD